MQMIVMNLLTDFFIEVKSSRTMLIVARISASANAFVRIPVTVGLFLKH